MNKNKEKHHVPAEGASRDKEQDKAAAGAKAPEEAVKIEPPAEVQPAVGPTPEAKPAKADLSTAAEQEIEQLKDQLLRLRADFDNYRKRVLRDKAEIYENANESLIMELLPVLDHLQLALQSAGKHHADRAIREGLQLIYDQLMDGLSKFGLESFNSEKQTFNHNLHEAISSLPSESEPEGVILAQSRQGYRLKNKILRPAQVVVSSGKAAPAQAAPENHPK